MSKIVFILGAGASKEAGAPLMCEFLNQAYDIWQLGKVSEIADKFKKVFEAIGALQSVHSKSQLDLRNVESVFAAFEMAKLLNKFPGLDKTKISEQIDAMKILIVNTLGQSIPFQFDQDHGFEIPKPYGEFLNLIKYLQIESNINYSVSVLTFNYDILIDVACLCSNLAIDYCLDPDITSGGLPILKLHGSTHWGYCSKCMSVVPYDINRYSRELGLYGRRIKKRTIFLDISAKFDQFVHCGEKVDPIPVIVPPTWNKSDYHNQISNVWQRAAYELQEAEHIFVIGYSLPSSDAFFRYLYALGTVGQNPLKSFCVYDPAKSKVSPRFENMLGSGVNDIYDCKDIGFSEAIPIIKAKFPPKERSYRV